MSWKHSGQLVKGPPTSSNSNKLDPRYRPNLGGLTAFQREQQLAQRYGSSDAGPSKIRTEWDVLKENHRFIRDDEEPSDVSWEERLARAYESKLFKEFALIDLKHYKSRRLALRWRTAPEVVEGIGEETCGSLRCKYHQPLDPAPPSPRIGFDDLGPSISERGDDLGPSVSERGDDPGYRRRDKRRRKRMPLLRSFELPFVYEEAGERKEALVKVKLCPKCQAKLTWKPGKESASESEDEAELKVKSERRRDDRDRRKGDENSRRGEGDGIDRRRRDEDNGARRRTNEDHHREESGARRRTKEDEDRHRERRRSRSPRRDRRHET